MFDGSKFTIYSGSGKGDFQYGCAYDVNKAGLVVGSFSSTIGPWHAVAWKENKMIAILPQATSNSDLDSYCASVNIHGQIAGQAQNGHAFFYDSGVVTDLGTVGGSVSFATAINGSGSVVGYSAVSGNELTVGFVWSKGKLTRLPTLGGRESVARGINDQGVIVGQADTKDGSKHACKWIESKIIDLGTLGGNSSEAVSINDSGTSVGWSLDKARNSMAVIWEDNRIANLNDLVVSSDHIELQNAIGINNRGEIVGTGLHKGSEGAFILSPIPKSDSRLRSTKSRPIDPRDDNDKKLIKLIERRDLSW